MISGNTLRDAYISGANNLSNYKAYVDSLNVFPVPDGDTGTNMSMTMSAASLELSTVRNLPAGEVAKIAASALLRGARGNSGVILSLLFRGFAKHLKGVEKISIEDYAKALELGVETAYKAVMNPTEGTMLTVSREAAEKACEIASSESDFVSFYEKYIDEARASLDRTPELLEVLKKAGVVDSGGMGLIKIFEGMLSVFKDGLIIEGGIDVGNEDIVIPTEDEEVDIDFPYCTEFIILKHDEEEDLLYIRDEIAELGNSLVFVDDDGIVKVHIHTKDPGKALSIGVAHGSLINMKIENMIEQNKAKNKKAANLKNKSFKYAPVDPSVDYGFVAISAGSGLDDLFTELSVDAIVSGGQTMNPSTEDILAAVSSVPAKTVFVLPNNKNIIMAAEQVIKLADREVVVLATKTIPQGISAMLAFDPDLSVRENSKNMTSAFKKVATGQITFAARDSEFDGHSIKKGEMLGLLESKLVISDKDISKVIAKLLKNMVRKNSSFVTFIVGEDMSEDRAQSLIDAACEKLDDGIEISILRGEQPVYHFIISVE